MIKLLLKLLLLLAPTLFLQAANATLQVNQLHGFNVRVSGCPAIALVGSASNVGTNGDEVAVDISGLGLQEGDVVVVAGGVEDGGTPAMSTAGYTTTILSGDGTNIGLVAYKLMGSTPDTDATMAIGGGAGQDGRAVVVQAFRNVNSAVILDTAIAQSGGTGGSGNPDGPAVTTVTDGALVISAVVGNENTITSPVTAPSGYSNLADDSSSDTFSANVAMASVDAGAAGSEDPGAWGWAGGSNLNSHGAATIALRSECAAGALPSYTRGTCVSDTSNLTTYNSAGFQALGTGASDADTVLVIVGVMSEDSAGTYNVSSMTIDGNAATELVDEAGSTFANTAIYASATTMTNAATVNVSVTFSEALTGSATVCAWALKDLLSTTPTSTVADDATTSDALVLTLSSTTANGIALGVCTNIGAADAATWAVLTEREDTQSAEMDYSNADAATTGSSMSVTCDWTGTNNASGSAAAFR